MDTLEPIHESTSNTSAIGSHMNHGSGSSLHLFLKVTLSHNFLETTDLKRDKLDTVTKMSKVDDYELESLVTWSSSSKQQNVRKCRLCLEKKKNMR